MIPYCIFKSSSILILHVLVSLCPIQNRVLTTMYKTYLAKDKRGKSDKHWHADLRFLIAFLSLALFSCENIGGGRSCGLTHRTFEQQQNRFTKPQNMLSGGGRSDSWNRFAPRDPTVEDSLVYVQGEHDIGYWCLTFFSVLQTIEGQHMILALDQVWTQDSPWTRCTALPKRSPGRLKQVRINFSGHQTSEMESRWRPPRRKC